MSQIHNPGGFDRGAKTELRVRRALQDLQAAVEQGTLIGISPGGGLGFEGDPALLTVITQPPLFTDAMGVGLNFVAPLILSGDDLDIALTAPIILDAGAIALDFGAGLDAPGGVLTIDLDANSGLQVGGNGLSIDLSQSPSVLTLTAGGLGTQVFTLAGSGSNLGARIDPTGTGTFVASKPGATFTLNSNIIQAEVDATDGNAVFGSTSNLIAVLAPSSPTSGIFMLANNGFALYGSGTFASPANGMILMPDPVGAGSIIRGAPGGPMVYTGPVGQVVTFRGHDGTFADPTPGSAVFRGGNRSSAGAGGAALFAGGNAAGTNQPGADAPLRGGRPTGSGASRALVQSQANSGAVLTGVEVRVVPSSTTAVQLGFYGVTPVARPDVTGARNDPEAALANLLTALENLGLITDSTTAT